MKLAVSLVAMVLAAAGCSSSNVDNTGATDNARVRVDIAQLTGPSSVQPQAPVDIQLGVGIDNISKETVTVRRVEIQQIGRGSWMLQPGAQRSFAFNRTVAAGATDEVTFWVHAYAVTMRGNIGDTEPVSLRAIVFFDSPSGSFREVRQKMIEQF